MNDIANRIIQFETEEMDTDEIVDLFIDLANSGILNHFQGHYGRTFRDLLAYKLIEIKDNKAVRGANYEST
jgi:hypothetical protein